MIHGGLMPTDAESWRALVESFTKQLADEITDIERAAPEATRPRLD